MTPGASRQRIGMPMSKVLLWLVAFMPLVANARNCTYPFATNENVGWQPGACYRGTWNIISTCITTIVACTWSIQHLNVPSREDSTFVQTRRKVKWMVITVLFPELVLILAVFQFYTAMTALIMIKDSGKPVEWPWWFRKRPFSWLPCNRERSSSNDTEKQEERKPLRKWTLTHCYFANMGGFILLRPESEHSHPATAVQLANSSFTSPPVSMEEIKDKSKQNWLAKSLAALQICQLILSVITRRILGAAFSQLETVTLTFAACGILIYCINFYKPQNIDWAVDITSLAPKPPSETVDATARDQPDTEQIADDDRQGVMPAAETPAAAQPVMWHERHGEGLISIMLNRTRSGVFGFESWLRIPNDHVPTYESQHGIHPAIYLLALASGLFGAMHAIAWDFEFPTAVETLLWRIATGVSTASPVVGLLVVPLAQFNKSAGDPQEFMDDCITMLREKQLDDASYRSTTYKALVSRAIHLLEERVESTTYETVFATRETRSLLTAVWHWAARRHNSPDHKGDVPLRVSKDFLPNLQRLRKVLLDGAGTKSLVKAAVTDVWPRKPVFPPAVNLGIVCIASFLYCASRLMLLGISLSSMRKMPGSVYIETNWTKYLPKFGANGG